MNIKAQGLLRENFVGLVIGSIVIVALIYFASGIADTFTNVPESATTNSFDRVVSGIVNLTSEPKEKGDLSIEILFNLQDNFGLLGFESPTLDQSCSPTYKFWSSLEAKQCIGLPCLCAASLSRNFWPTNSDYYKFVSCTPQINNARYFYAVSSPETDKFNRGNTHVSGLGKNLALWSDCSTPSLTTRNLKITRHAAGDKYDFSFELLPK